MVIAARNSYGSFFRIGLFILTYEAKSFRHIRRILVQYCLKSCATLQLHRKQVFTLSFILFQERVSPWPKFDKAVLELHDWLDTLSEMMKTEKIVLGDSEDMEGLLEKQKVC